MKPLCKALFDSYCNYLYGPEAMGNLIVKRATASTSTTILAGETRNEFTQVYFKYSLAKLRNRRALPHDFAMALQRLSYFEKLRLFIDRPPRDRMVIAQRLDSEQTNYELGYIWSSAINETTLARMIKKYPGFHKLSDRLVPVELDLERRRIRRELISDISKAIWRDDNNWRRVEDGFATLQRSYQRAISNLDLDETLKADWIKRIQDIHLVLPGSMPAISDEECSTTNINAYYYPFLNILTVCAGDFNSEDIIQTLAHEMGHAIDIDRTQYLFETKSKFGGALSELRGEVCTARSFSCNTWGKFKESFDANLASLDSYRPQLPEFNRCLKRRPTSRPLGADDISRIAHTIIADRISNLAGGDRFLRITKAEIPMRNGKQQKNPNYLNPCSYYLWSKGEEPLDDELTTLMFFTAEYRCSEGDASDKLRESIDVARALSEKVLQSTLKIEGEFSARSELEHGGFSSPPYERFADVLGSYAMSELLKELPDQWDRQNKFLASSSWQCMEPSIASNFPEESAVEKEYVFDTHTEGEQRKKELFSTPIREVIGCQKDFEFNECSLPFKKK